jgi:hypothetical protein
MSSIPPQDGRDVDTRLNEIVDGVVRKVGTCMVISAAIVALAIYGRPAPPRYQAFAADGQIVRVDTRSGTVLACSAREGQCMRVVQRGQSLLPRPDPEQLPKPAPAPQQLPQAPTTPANPQAPTAPGPAR